MNTVNTINCTQKGFESKNTEVTAVHTNGIGSAVINLIKYDNNIYFEGLKAIYE